MEEKLTMQRVWKVASRWSDDGNQGSSIIEIFRKHNVVFVGKEQDRFAHISEGDLITISDGKRVVAMGLAIGKPAPITEMATEFSDKEKQRFSYSPYTWGCRVSFTDLPQKAWCDYRIGTFHGVNQRADKFREVFRQYRDRLEEKQEFEIKARTCKLVSTSDDANTSAEALFREGTHFQIPVYQRSYSWKQPQVRKLLTDLLISFRGENGKVPREPVFIGTMQLSFPKREDEKKEYHEVIDGQQRLSTLLLILKVLRDFRPEHPFFKQIRLEDVLQTRVSNGVQQEYLREALAKELGTEVLDGHQNPYLRVIPDIVDLLQEPSETDDTDSAEPSDHGDFITYLSSRVFFVVIETYANLSKTLQIFDAINTAGLDLNGGDVFKVRYFDYLKNVKKYGDESFEEISSLYELIDSENKTIGKQICSIESVLGLLQHILIARHGLPKGLHDMRPSTFFERLFDTVLNVNDWSKSGFTFDKCKGVDVKLDELKQLIKVFFSWRNGILEWEVEPRCSVDFFWWSRYWRYDYMPRLFQYRFGADTQQNQAFTIALSKLLSTYSILYKKSVVECHNIIADVTSQIFSSDRGAADIIRYIEEKSANKKNELQDKLAWEPIAFNAKTKNLVCRYVAFLDERESGQLVGSELRKKLFDWDIDIEHIESANHKDGSKRQDVWSTWGDDLHSIGNLMVLERNLNRSIGNENYGSKKLPTYRKSQYVTAQKQATSYPSWDLASCRTRKETEVNRLVDYLCTTSAGEN